MAAAGPPALAPTPAALAPTQAERDGRAVPELKRGGRDFIGARRFDGRGSLLAPRKGMSPLSGLLQFFGARFDSPDLEARYQWHRLKVHFMRDDRFQAWVRFIVTALFALDQMWKQGMGRVALAAMATMPVPLAHVVIRSVLCRRGNGGRRMVVSYARARLALACCTYIFFDPLVLGVYSTRWFRPPGEDAGAGQYTAHVLKASATLLPLYDVVLFPQPLEHHLLLQPALVVAMVTIGNVALCGDALLAPRLATHVVGFWAFLDRISWGILSAVYMQDVAPSRPPGALAACRHYVVGVHALVSIIFCTYIVWLREQRWRAQFLAEVCGRRWWGAEWPWSPRGASALFHACFAALLLAIVWQALGGAETV